MEVVKFVSNFCNASTVILALLVIAILKYLHSIRRPSLYPPGPMGLPLLGYIPFLGSNMAETFRKLKKKYGTVISVNMGGEDFVVLNDYDTIHEALVKQGDKFSGRPKFKIFEALALGDGLATADYGTKWKVLRKFGLKTLRGFGIGKKSMETTILEECNYLIGSLADDTSKRTVTEKFTAAVSNIICGVVFGSRYNYDDEKFSEIIRRLSRFSKDSFDAPMLAIVFFAPFVQHLPVFRGVISRTKEDYGYIMKVVQEVLKEHESSYVEDDLRDFIDAFLKESKEGKDGNAYFNEAILVNNVRDLFEAGTETTSTTLLWSMLCFCHYPESQDKIAEEIQMIIGESGVPTMKHREQMPYTRAFIQEIMRHRTLVPLSVFHKTNETSHLRGFVIPKNTTIIPNIWSVHFDPELFSDPDEFKPERFLDDDGKFVKSKHVIPFSIGPRFCVGEQLATMEVFLFIISIVQKFHVLPDPVGVLPSFHDGLFDGAAYGPKEFEVLFESR